MSIAGALLAQVNPDGDDLFVAQNIFFGIIAAVMIVSALRVVKALDRAAGPLFALFLAQHPTGPCRALVGSRHGA